MPPTLIESVRPWFLALPQLQKTLVFGGLGLISGWVTTGLIQAAMTFIGLNQDPVAVALGRYVIAPIVPGKMLCLLVTLPILYLERGTSDGWPRTLLIMILLHPAAFFMFLLLSGTIVPAVVPSGPPTAPELCSAAVVAGGIFGFILTRCSTSLENQENWTTYRLTVFSMIVASLLISLGQKSLSTTSPAGSMAIMDTFRTALVFVTLHTAAAVCLSIRAWPELPKVAPPPLDNPATLPP